MTRKELWFILYLARLGNRRIHGGDTGIVEVFYSTLLALSAFWLGACPFSVWIGQWTLGKDIRDYGDGNPGAFNVFRAGGRKSGFLAIIVDIAKGVPFVLLAHSFFGLREPVVLAIALCAILGHAFSPLLGLRGGKAVAVTFGVLCGLPHPDMLTTLVIFILLGFLFIENDAWIVMLGPSGSLAYLILSGASYWESLFMMCVLAILAIKHFDELHTVPRLKVKLIGWLQSRRRVT